MSQLIDPWTISHTEAERRADLAKRYTLHRLAWIDRHVRPLSDREFRQFQKLAGFDRYGRNV